PVRELYAECPEPLDQVVLRCLHKERDLRYPSLDELLLDVKPVLIDLQHEQARALFSEAERLVKSGSEEAAQSRLRQALEFDPSNRDARRLRDQLQQSLQKQAVRPRVE